MPGVRLLRHLVDVIAGAAGGGHGMDLRADSTVFVCGDWFNEINRVPAGFKQRRAHCRAGRAMFLPRHRCALTPAGLHCYQRLGSAMERGEAIPVVLNSSHRSDRR